jgi:hypothetical protein
VIDFIIDLYGELEKFQQTREYLEANPDATERGYNKSEQTYEIINNIVASILSQPKFADVIRDREERLGVDEDNRLDDNSVDWFYDSQSFFAQKSREEIFSELSSVLTEDNFFGGCDEGETSTYLSANDITTICRYNPCDESTHTIATAKCAVEKAVLPGIEKGLISALSVYKVVGEKKGLGDIREFAEREDREAAIEELAERLEKGNKAESRRAKEKRKELARKLLEDFEKAKQATKTAIQNSPFGGVDIGFKEQCFFLAHLQTFMALRGKLRGVIREEQLGRHFFEKKMPSVNEDGAEGNRCMQLHGEPFGFINKLTQSPSKSYFFDRIDAAALSTLQPMIRLFKVETDENGREYTVELNFDSYSRDIALSLQTQGKRGSGVGINDFSFAYEATNPFGIKKTITSKLSIFANSFNELLAPRYGTGTYDDGTLKTEVTYQYTDLALKTTSQTFKKAKFNPQNADVALRDYEKVKVMQHHIVGMEILIIMQYTILL